MNEHFESNTESNTASTHSIMTCSDGLFSMERNNYPLSLVCRWISPDEVLHASLKASIPSHLEVAFVRCIGVYIFDLLREPQRMGTKKQRIRVSHNNTSYLACTPLSRHPADIEIVCSVEIFLAGCLVPIVLLQPPCFSWPSQGATFFPFWNRVTGAIFGPRGDLKYA